MILIDIIILSYAKNSDLKRITENCLKSLFASEKNENVGFYVIVIESNTNLKPFEYPGTNTIYPDEPFGYNKFINIGLQKSSKNYVCICNNDLIFHEGWANEILSAMKKNSKLKSANPYCSFFDYHPKIVSGPDIIYRHKNLKINGILTGWCIFFKREILQKTGLFDEQFEFWYADNDYDMTLREHKISHALIKKSKVDHVGMKSHDTIDDIKKMTIDQRIKFDNKWHKNRWQNLSLKIKDFFHV